MQTEAVAGADAIVPKYKKLIATRGDKDYICDEVRLPSVIWTLQKMRFSMAELGFDRVLGRTCGV